MKGARPREDIAQTDTRRDDAEFGARRRPGLRPIERPEDLRARMGTLDTRVGELKPRSIRIEFRLGRNTYGRIVGAKRQIPAMELSESRVRFHQPRVTLGPSRNR